MEKYKIKHISGEIYHVIKVSDDKEYSTSEKVFQGFLLECESYIRLREGGYFLEDEYQK